MSVSLILPVSVEVPTDVIEAVIRDYINSAIINHEIIVVDYNSRYRPIQNAHVYPVDGYFNLAEARNYGARQATGETLVFSDIDICYEPYTIINMLKWNVPVVRGVTRGDVENIGDKPTSYYKCSNSPMMINAWYFRQLGGYCEDYKSWGYEDSDFEHKLLAIPISRIQDFDTKAIHVKSIHQYKSPTWKHGNDDNRGIFERRLLLPVCDRIQYDRERFEVQ
jgi:hypothetical protein